MYPQSNNVLVKFNHKRTNHFRLSYKGHTVATGYLHVSGYYEVRPKADYYHPYDRTTKMLTYEQMVEFAQRAEIKLHMRKGRTE